MFFSRSKSTIPAPEEALAGRPERPFHLSPQHLVLDAPLVTDPQTGGVPEGHEAAFALTMEYLVWRSARGLDASPHFERLVNRFTEQAATSEAVPGLWPFEAYRE